MSRVLICANTLSGKTSFMYGTFHQMIRGIYGFTLTPKYHFARFNRQCKRIGDISLPLNERFPAPSDRIEEYTFILKYNLKTVDEIQWIDYPGNLVEEDEENPDNVRLMEYMDGADCLFLCVDGRHFNHDSRSGAVHAVNCDGGGLELNFMLNRAALDAKTGRDRELPPVCLIITKYDLVDPDKRKEEFLLDVLREIFPILFTPSAKKQGRLVSICPVTLGRDIGQGGRLDPRNMEKPFCYLTFLRMAFTLSQYREQMETAREELLLRRAREDSSLRYRLIRRLWSYGPTGQTAEEGLGRMVETCSQLERDLTGMKRSLQNMALFYNGRQIPWEQLVCGKTGAGVEAEYADKR